MRRPGFSGITTPTDMHHQRLRAQVAPTGNLQTTNKVVVIAGHTYPEHPALYADRPDAPVASNQGVLHFCPSAKYAIAFPRPGSPQSPFPLR